MQLASHPIVIYILMSAGLVGLLLLHFHLLNRVERLRRQAADEWGAWRLESSRLQAELNSALVSRAAPQSSPLPAGPVLWHDAGSRLNITKRSQALRMSRSGDSPERIAAALGIARSEVQLLLKVHHSAAGAA